MTPVSRGGPAVDQARHDPLCQMLRKVLMDAAQASEIGSVPLRACAALYGVLLDHPVDEWGRCRSCHRPGLVFGPQWHPCQLHRKVTLCLRHLDEVMLLDLLADERGVPATSS
jgi:hypothetical protein